MAVRSIRPAHSVRLPRVVSKWPGMPSLLLALLILTMYAELYLGDLDIGPASSRIYLLAVALIGLAVLTVKRRIDIVPSRNVGLLFAVYAAFIVWAFINTMVRDGALGDTVRDLGTTLIFGWLLLIAAQAVIHRTRDVLIISGALFASAALSGTVAILQWFDIEAAWDFARLLRPDERFDSFNGVAGLALFSVPLSYHLGVVSTLLIGPALWWRLQSRSLYLIIWSVVALAGFGIVVTVSRSAVMASLASLILIAVVQVIRRPGRDFSAPIRWKRKAALGTALVVFAISGLAAIAIANEVSDKSRHVPERGATFSLSRLTNFYNADRTSLASYALASWLDSPLIGDQPAWDAGWQDRLDLHRNLGDPRLPHNLVLNSLILYGAIGTAIILSFVGLAIWIGMSVVREVYRHPLLGPLAVSAMVALLWFLINAQFHNESFVSGSTLGMWLIAILIGIERISQTRSPSPA